MNPQVVFQWLISGVPCQARKYATRSGFLAFLEMTPLHDAPSTFPTRLTPLAFTHFLPWKSHTSVEPGVGDAATFPLITEFAADSASGVTSPNE